MVRRTRRGQTAQLEDGLDHALCAFPCLLFGRRDNRTERDAESDRAAVAGGGHTHLADYIRALGERLTPDRVDIRMLCANFDRRIGRAAEIDRYMRLLHGLDVRQGALEAIVPPLVIDGPLGRPYALQNVDVFVR